MTVKQAKSKNADKTAQFTTLKVRLYPNEAQVELFEKTFGSCRYIWNQMLADQKRFYIEERTLSLPRPSTRMRPRFCGK